MSVASRRATDACRLPKMGDRARIDRVGLGALADGLGDGLEHDQIGLHYLERSPQLVEPSASARNNETLTIGRTATSRRSFKMSIPHMMSMATRPCLSELAGGLRRLFGFDGTAGGVLGSRTVLRPEGNRTRPPPRLACYASRLAVGAVRACNGFLGRLSNEPAEFLAENIWEPSLAQLKKKDRARIAGAAKEVWRDVMKCGLRCQRGGR